MLLINQKISIKNDPLRLPRVSISHNTTPNDHLKTKTQSQRFIDFLQHVITSEIQKFSF